jgi:S-adenosylmethionine hydrolase
LLRVVYKGKTYSLPFLQTYGQAEDRLFCLFNNEDELEIAIPKKNAAGVIGAEIGQAVIIKF